MSAQENPTGIESVHNTHTRGAQEIVQGIGGARTVPTAPRVPPALLEAGAQQASLGKASGNPHPDILKAVSVSEDPKTGRGWFDNWRERAMNKTTDKAA